MRAAMRGSPCNRDEGLCDSVKEQGIDEACVLKGEGLQRIREGKHHVEIGDVEHFPLPVGQPDGLGCALTLRTVPVSAGVIAALAIPALVTRGRMASQRRGPTQRDGAEHALLRPRGDVPVPRERGCAILPPDLRHFECGARHSRGSSTLTTSGCSRGLGVVCSALLATWR